MRQGGTKAYFEEHYDIVKLRRDEARAYISEHHYTHGCHNAPAPCYGLMEDGKLIGACVFANPCTDAVRKSVWGEELKRSVIELHRLFIEDGTPRNTESWFVTNCLKRLHADKPHIKGVLSFADSTEGHVGTIYRAANFHFVGFTAKRETFYKDGDGRLHHPHQNSRNISKAEAAERGWTPDVRQHKYRYLYIIADSRRERRHLETCGRFNVRKFEWCPICGEEHPIGTKCECEEMSLANASIQ